MTRLSAIPLDLSRFPAPVAIRGVDFDRLRLSGLSLLKQAFAQFGIDWDVETIEGTPGAIINRALTFREFLAYVRINDAVRAVMVAFATGSDLDHLGAFHGVERRTISAGVAESDSEFRRRVLLAPEAWAAAGPLFAYVFHALGADPRVLNADVWTKPGTGIVRVAIQSREGAGTADSDLVQAVSTHLNRADIKPLTDQVVVTSIVNVPYQISVRGSVLFGPDPLTAKAEAEESLAAMAAERRTPSRDVPRSAVFAAAMVGSMDKVIVDSPAEDIASGYGEVAYCTGIHVEVSAHDG
jgi:phage-related baseplate assembly protein